MSLSTAGHDPRRSIVRLLRTHNSEELFLRLTFIREAAMIEGVVTDGGQPVEGVEIMRRTEYAEADMPRSVFTNREGEFDLRQRSFRLSDNQCPPTLWSECVFPRRK